MGKLFSKVVEMPDEAFIIHNIDEAGEMDPYLLKSFSATIEVKYQEDITTEYQ